MGFDPLTLELIARLRHLNVHLSCEGGQLRCNAPAGAVTAELRNELAGRKSEILAFLGNVGFAVSDSIAPVPRDGTLVLSFAQQRLWLLDQLEPGNFAYNIPAWFRLEGRLDVGVLRASITEIVRRHEVLRTCYPTVAGQPVVKIMPPEPLRLPVIDLQTLELSQQREEGTRIAHADSIQPFRLDRAPLLRVSLLKFGPESHVLLLTLSHIAFDGWSFGILVNELSALYTAGVQRERSPLPEPAVQYADFAAWQQKIFHENSLQPQIDYWKQTLGGRLPVLELPTDRPRPARQTANGGSVFCDISQPVTDALKTVSQNHGTTIFVTLLAIFTTLLKRYSGQEEILVGTPVANRSRTEVEQLVGLFVNTLVLRTDLSANPTCAQLIHRIHKLALAAYAHQDVPFEKLVEVVNPERDASHSPLFQTMFSLEQSPLTKLELPGLEPVWPEIRGSGAQFDLSLYLTETDHSLIGRFSFNSDLFDQATVVRMKDHFQTLVGEFIRDTELRVNELPILPDAEREQLLAFWSRTGDPYPAEAGVHELFELEAARRPHAVAVECGRERLTYLELSQRSNQLAAYLQTLALGREALIGVCVERSVGLAVALLAVLKAGASYLPLDVAFPKGRLAFMLEDGRPAALITETSRQDALPAHNAFTIHLDRFPWGEHKPPYRRPEYFDRAYVLYTSGSQGKPKGVEICHRSLVNFLTAMRNAVGMDENDILLSVTTLSFDIFGLELWLPLTTGATTVIASNDTCKDGTLLSRAIGACGATQMQATPNTWRMLLESEWRGSSRLKILCGGEAWSKELALRLLPRCASLWNMYGPTETTIWSAVQRIDSTGEVRVGPPIGNTQFYVVNSHLQLQPAGVPGELLIGGDGLARGYLNRPELSRERFIDNPFVAAPDSRVYRTGDLVRTRADGTIEFLSRLDEQVKLRGFRIELGEIETLLRKSSSLEEAVVVLRQDNEPRLAAYCVRSKNAEITTTGLRQLLTGYLPEYMIPSEFVFLPEMPLTPNGKVDRKALIALPPQPREIVLGADEASDELERNLTVLWEKVLRVHPVYASDNFFDLGGHSFAAVQLLAEIQKLTGKRLPLALLFRAATVKLLAEILRRDEGSEWPMLVPIRAQGSKPPLFLVHGAEGNVLLYRQFTEYLDPDWPVYGLQSQGLNGEDPVMESIEEMAGQYAREIIAIEPSGPYFLGGYCLGGVIALEIAQQLTAAGKDVAQVLMFETYNLHGGSSRNLGRLGLVHRFQNVWFHLANVAMVNAAERRRFLGEKVDIARARAGIRISALRHYLGNRKRDAALRRYPHLAIKKANDEAANLYIPKRYGGPVAVIRPKRYFAGLASPSFGWGELFGKSLEIHEIPIYPKGMLVEPFCRSLAQLVMQCLTRADSEVNSSGRSCPKEDVPDLSPVPDNVFQSQR